jgi:hypothetical protein
VKIGPAIRELHRSERKLARNLHAIAARHHADSDIHHVALDLARWSERHLRDLSERGQRHGVNLSPRPRQHVSAFLLQVRLADAVRHRQEPAMMLLADLRRVYLVAAGVSVDWELLGQASRAAKADDLLELTSRCHPQTLRQCGGPPRC